MSEEERILEKLRKVEAVRYFGGALKVIPNMIKVGLHTNKFLGLSAVENYLLTEYRIRS